VSPDVVTIQRGRAFGSDRGVTRGKDYHLGNVMVDEDCDSIEGVRNGEFSDEVHGDCGEGDCVLLGNDRDKGNLHTIGQVFCGLAGGAAVDVCEDKLRHVGPVVRAADGFEGFNATRMASDNRIVGIKNDGVVEINVHRDIETTPIVDQSVLNLPVLGQGGLRDGRFWSKEITKNIKYLRVELLGVFDVIEEGGVDEVICNVVGPRE